MKSMTCFINGTLLVIFINLVTPMHSFTQPFDIPVKMGTFSVGFRSYGKMDKSKILNVSNLDSAINKQYVPARPVLVNIWYPVIQDIQGIVWKIICGG